MNYNKILESVKSQFKTDEKTADALIKSVLGNLINLKPEEIARDFVKPFPPQLSFDTLRGHLLTSKVISVDQFVQDIKRQFSFSTTQVKLLTRTIFEFLKNNSPSHFPLWERSLPFEWVGLIEYMEEKTESERIHHSNMININKADRLQLSRIDGMGKELADKIIKYRDEHGGFRDLDEINLIAGFDKIITEKIKEKVYIG